MQSRSALMAIVTAGIVVVGTSAWTINEVRKNNRAIFQLNERVQAAQAESRQEIAGVVSALNTTIDSLRPATVGHEHSDVRVFMIAAHLARVVSPIVVFGDSITEAAILPDTICGHAVVNAGIGGAGVDELLKVAPSLLEGKSPALVVLAVGTNDAYPSPGREKRFSEAYAALLQHLEVVVPKIVVASIPPVDPKGPLTVATGIDAGLIDRYNLILSKLAEGAGASFIDLNKAVGAEGAMETIDGIHLAPRAYGTSRCVKA